MEGFLQAPLFSGQTPRMFLTFKFPHFLSYSLSFNKAQGKGRL